VKVHEKFTRYEQAADWMTGRSRVQIPAGADVCLFSIASKPVVAPFNLLSSGYWELRWPVYKTSYSPLTSRLRMCGALDPLPHTSPWHGLIKHVDMFM
jgi:hypothetical protein